jgi:DNA-binding transcriptional ArsR family regulator
MNGDLETFRLHSDLNLGKEGGKAGYLNPPEQFLHRTKGRFIRGPINLSWLLHASDLRGKSPMKLALAIHFQAGLENSKTDIRLTKKLRQEFGISDRTVSRALGRLEDAGLVSVQRKTGRCHVVTIRDSD